MRGKKIINRIKLLLITIAVILTMNLLEQHSLYVAATNCDDLAVYTAAYGSQDENSPALTNIVIQLGSDESQLNFTWFSKSSTYGKIVYAAEEDFVGGVFSPDATAIVAERTSSVKEGYFGNKATIFGLKPNKTYYYQIINGNDKTEIHHITTGGESFSFAFAGDAQIGRGYGNDATQNRSCIADDAMAWGLTLSQMANSDEFAGVDFMMSAGDQTNSMLNSHEGHELQWDAYSNHQELLDIPIVTVAGNHDNNYPCPIYPYHVNQPNMLTKPDGTYYGATYNSYFVSADYYYTYNNVLFIVLNTNTFKANDASDSDTKADIAAAQDHGDFIDRVLEETKNREFDWTIVLCHHSPYGSSYHGYYLQDEDGVYKRTEQYAYDNIKKYLYPKLYEVGVDLVLSGHDHCYTRTHILKPAGYGLDTVLITAYDTENSHSYYEYADGTISPTYAPWTDLNSNIYENLKVKSTPVKVVNPDGILHVTAATSSGSQVNPAAYENIYCAVQATANMRHLSRIDITKDDLTIKTYNMGTKTTEDIILVDSFTIVKECAHVGGVPTCEQKAVCTVCADTYGDPNNHTQNAKWIIDPYAHEKLYECCGEVLLAKKSHTYNGTKCEECGYSVTLHVFVDGICSTCNMMRGDIDGNQKLNEVDPIYLLQHVLMPEYFVVKQDADLDLNGCVDEDDAIYLLQHVLMADAFPLSSECVHNNYTEDLQTDWLCHKSMQR